MEKLDGLILNAVANRVFTPQRVEAMMKELQKNLKALGRIMTSN